MVRFLQLWLMIGLEVRRMEKLGCPLFGEVIYLPNFLSFYGSYIPPKFSFILWLGLRGRLNTKSKWIGDHDRTCTLCKSSMETN